MKRITFVALAAGLAAVTSAWGSPVKVKHDIRSGAPSEVRAEGVLQASPEQVWAQIIRFNEYAQFMPNVLESFFIREEGVGALRTAGTENANKLRAVARPFKIPAPRKEGGRWEGLLFMVLNTPFPVENRWYVIRTTQDESRAAEHLYKRCWELVTGNIKSSKGCWTFELGPGPGETVSRYEDQADPGGKVPEWVTRAGATKTIPEMFRRIEKLAQSQE